jgi:hypothetical protein
MRNLNSISLDTRMTAVGGIEATDHVTGARAGAILWNGATIGWWLADSGTERKEFKAREAAEYWLLAMYIERVAVMEAA